MSTGKILTDFWCNIFILQRRKQRPSRENFCPKMTKFKLLLLLCSPGNAMPPAQNTSLGLPAAQFLGSRGLGAPKFPGPRGR